MKSKTTTAVLLSLVAMAGLAVNDVYAQSNTERLVSIDENSESIKGTVEGIADDTDVLSAMVSAIQDTLNGMADTLTNIMNAVTGVQTSVNSVAMDVTQMNSKIDGIETTLMGLSGIGDRLDNIDIRISGLVGDDQILSVLSSTVTSTNDRLDQVINRLDAIQAGLESANIRIAEIETTPTTPRPGNILLSGESELNVNSYHYGQHGDSTTNRGSHFYELEMTFSCNNDVFIETVELFLDPTADDPYQYMKRYGNTAPTDADGWADVLNNYVKVHGRDLYNNKLPVGGGNYAEFHRTADFNNQQLKAGDRLEFESLLYEGIFVRSGATQGDMVKTSPADADNGGVGGNLDELPPGADNEYLIHNSNKTTSKAPDANNALYEINVEWFSYISGTTCSIGFGSGSAVGPGLTKSDTLSYGVATDPANDKDVIKKYSDTIDCGGNPVEITDITAGTGDDWRLASFADVFIIIGSDEYELTFDDEAEEPEFENVDEVLPLHVGGEDITISGKIAVANLLLTIHYNTVSDAECVVEPDY